MCDVVLLVVAVAQGYRMYVWCCVALVAAPKSYKMYVWCGVAG
jgi:hypothetical protein